MRRRLACNLRNLSEIAVEIYLPDECGEATFSGMYGVNLLSQPGRTYPKNQDCILHLEVPRGFIFNIVFKHFDLEPPAEDGTCSDYLQFFNGQGLEMRLTEPLCGNELPAPVSSNSSIVTLKFHTNDQKEYTGFKLMYDRSRAKILEQPNAQQNSVSGGNQNVG